VEHLNTEVRYGRAIYAKTDYEKGLLLGETRSPLPSERFELTAGNPGGLPGHDIEKG
jgi:hypothetical protein